MNTLSKYILYLIWFYFIYVFISILYQGVVYHEIFVPRKSYSDYLIKYDDEPNAFWIIMAFSSIILSVLFYVLFSNLKKDKNC